jgi:hypothetical protein
MKAGSIEGLLAQLGDHQGKSVYFSLMNCPTYSKRRRFPMPVSPTFDRHGPEYAQAFNHREHNLLQLADFLVGAVGFVWNGGMQRTSARFCNSARTCVAYSDCKESRFVETYAVGRGWVQHLGIASCRIITCCTELSSLHILSHKSLPRPS